eukprot:5220219-Ditylum_brightwellii.AAC.1
MHSLLSHTWHFKTADVEIRGSFDLSAIPLIPNASSLKLDNVQELNSPTDVLEQEKKLQKVIKFEPVEAEESKFDVVDDILKGDALAH